MPRLLNDANTCKLLQVESRLFRLSCSLSDSRARALIFGALAEKSCSHPKKVCTCVWVCVHEFEFLRRLCAPASRESAVAVAAGLPLAIQAFVEFHGELRARNSPDGQYYVIRLMIVSGNRLLLFGRVAALWGNRFVDSETSSPACF